MSKFILNQSSGFAQDTKKISFNRFKGFLQPIKNLFTTDKTSIQNQNIKYYNTLYKKDSFEVLEKSISKDSSATTLHNPPKGGTSPLKLCEQNISTIFNTGSSLNFPKGNHDCSLLSTDFFYTQNSEVIIDISLPSGAKSEFKKISYHLQTSLPQTVYESGTNKFMEPTVISALDSSTSWKQEYKDVNLKVSYNNLKNELVSYTESIVSARVKGYGSFRPYNRKSAFKIRTKSGNFIDGLGDTTDLVLNNMVGDPSKLAEVISYKLYNDYGMPAPRANLFRLFINDQEIYITNITNNLITTSLDHYLLNGSQIKFNNLSSINNNQIFYVINSDRTNKTFKVSLTLNGTEFTLPDYSGSLQFSTDFGEYVNVEGITNLYKLNKTFGINNTKHIYEVICGGHINNELDPYVGYEIDYGDGDISDLENFINKLHPHNSGYWYNEFASVADIEQFIKFVVMELYLGQGDGYTTGTTNAHYHSDKNGIFRVIPWGSDTYLSNPIRLREEFSLTPSLFLRQCFGNKITLLKFKNELLKFHNWVVNSSNIVNYIETIFNTEKMIQIAEDKKLPSDQTFSTITGSRTAILNLLASRQSEVNLFLQRPLHPENLKVSLEGTTINISWDKVTKNLNDTTINNVNYIIYANTSLDMLNLDFSYIQTTSNNSWSGDISELGIDLINNTTSEFIFVYVSSFITGYSGFPSEPFIIPIEAQTPAQLVRITEVMSNANSPSPNNVDWFELTNLGTSSVNISNWKIDDNSRYYNFAVSLNRYNGWDGQINPGESIICIETSTPNTTVPAFIANWNLDSSIKIATYFSSNQTKPVSLSSNGDAVIVYNESGGEEAIVYFGLSKPGKSFYFEYSNIGRLLVRKISDIYENKGAYKSTLGHIGSPGIYIS